MTFPFPIRIRNDHWHLAHITKAAFRWSCRCRTTWSVWYDVLRPSIPAVQTPEPTSWTTQVFKMAERNNTVTVSLYNWNCCQMNEIVYRVESIEWFTFHNHTESLIMQMIQAYCKVYWATVYIPLSVAFQTFRNTSFHVCILIIN